jgi:hypothetical protein
LSADWKHCLKIVTSLSFQLQSCILVGFEAIFANHSEQQHVTDLSEVFA